MVKNTQNGLARNSDVSLTKVGLPSKMVYAAIGVIQSQLETISKISGTRW